MIFFLAANIDILLPSLVTHSPISVRPSVHPSVGCHWNVSGLLAFPFSFAPALPYSVVVLLVLSMPTTASYSTVSFFLLTFLWVHWRQARLTDWLPAWLTDSYCRCRRRRWQHQHFPASCAVLVRPKLCNLACFTVENPKAAHWRAICWLRLWAVSRTSCLSLSISLSIALQVHSMQSTASSYCPPPPLSFPFLLAPNFSFCLRTLVNLISLQHNQSSVCVCVVCTAIESIRQLIKYVCVCACRVPVDVSLRMARPIISLLCAIVKQKYQQ